NLVMIPYHTCTTISYSIIVLRIAKLTLPHGKPTAPAALHPTSYASHVGIGASSVTDRRPREPLAAFRAWLSSSCRVDFFFRRGLSSISYLFQMIRRREMARTAALGTLVLALAALLASAAAADPLNGHSATTPFACDNGLPFTRT